MNAAAVDTRADVATTRDDEAIREDVERVLSALLPASRPVAVTVEDGVVLLLGRVEWRSTCAEVDEQVRAVPGVVEVRDRLGCFFDDTIRPRFARGAR